MNKEFKISIVESQFIKNENDIDKKMEKDLYYNQEKCNLCYAAESNNNEVDIFNVLTSATKGVKYSFIKSIPQIKESIISGIVASIKVCMQEKIDIVTFSLKNCEIELNEIMELQSVCREATTQGMLILAIDQIDKDYMKEFKNVFVITKSDNKDEKYIISYTDSEIGFTDNYIEFVDNTIHINELINSGNDKQNISLLFVLSTLLCQYLGNHTIDKEKVFGYLEFLNEINKLENKSKEYINPKNKNLNGKKLLFFADKMEIENNNLVKQFEKDCNVQLAFHELYEETEELRENLKGVDILCIGNLSKEFAKDNEIYLKNLVDIMMAEHIEVIAMKSIISSVEI